VIALLAASLVSAAEIFSEEQNFLQEVTDGKAGNFVPQVLASL